MHQPYRRLAIFTFVISLGSLGPNPLHAQIVPPPPNCASAPEVRSSAGLTTVMGTYPQNSASAARSVAAPQSADISLEAGRRMRPTVSTEEYAALKSAIAPHSK